jgi:hypothetical protein
MRGAALLPLRQDFRLLRGQSSFAGVAARFGGSGIFFSKSVFSACSRNGGLGFARRVRARAFFSIYPAVDGARCSAFCAELRPAHLIFPS